MEGRRVLEENIGDLVFDLGIEKDFLAMTQIQKQLKNNNMVTGYIKMKVSCMTKTK